MFKKVSKNEKPRVRETWGKTLAMSVFAGK